MAWRRPGATVVLFAVVLVVVLAMVAIAVDSGYMMLRRTELQRSVDAAALGAADALRDATSEVEVEAAARSLLQANGIDPDALTSDQLRIETGSWDRDLHSFQATEFEYATAVRVSLDAIEGRLFFASLFGRSSFTVRGEAIAVSCSGGPPRDIMLVLDCSNSMDNDGGDPPQPMAGVKDAATLLCNTVTNYDRVGLTVYSWRDPDLYDRKTGRLEVHLTDSHEVVASRISDLTAGFYLSGTSIAGGIRVGGQVLRDTARDNVEKVLVVLTDGRANLVEPPYGVPAEDLPDGSPLDEPEGDDDESTRGWAEEVAGYGITIHTVSLGNEADHQLMAEVAALGDGDHYDITGGVDQYVQELLDTFHKIAVGDRGRAILVH
jgi:Mg-chelatase subunit ChlD